MRKGNINHERKGRFSDGLKDCPKCGNRYIGRPALSREDNKTNICPECGKREGLEDYKDFLKSIE